MQLRNSNASAILSMVIAITPLRVLELRAAHDNLVQLHAGLAGDVAGDDVDARAEAEDEARVGAFQDQEATSEEDLARGGDGDGGVCCGHGCDEIVSDG